MITNFKQAMEEAKRIYDGHLPGWITVAYDIAYEMLCAVPPIYVAKGFACGEPYSDRDGKQTYYCFRNHNEAAGTMECRICSTDELREAQDTMTIVQEQLDNLIGTFIPMKQWQKAFDVIEDIFQTLKTCPNDRRPKVPPMTFISIGNGGPVAYSILSQRCGAVFIRYAFAEHSGQMEESHKYVLPEDATARKGKTFAVRQVFTDKKGNQNA